MTISEINDELSTEERLYPEGLARWAGHRDGGVRRPFVLDSGRPTGDQIETPLVTRLHDWVSSLVAGEDVPRVLLLVGGPGNGKTDAVEGCIEFFDTAMKANGKLLETFASKYDVSDGELPPRKAVVDLSSVSNSLPSHLQTTISLVQDATEGDSSKNETPEELLLNELDTLLNPDHTGIYLCCVNRGILARTAEIAHEKGVHSDVSALLTVITKGVTSRPKSPSCWPLEGYSDIALWPMDVESLVDKNINEGKWSVAHQIFEVALDDEKWKKPCALNTRCPFCQNRKLLSQGKALDSLVDILHYYELTSGKRWTFRDLFSLVPYLLVGDHSELEIKGKRLSPCEWAAEQYRLSTEGRSGSVERDRAPYLLMSRLYHHRLFPKWPDFIRGEHREAKKVLLKNRDNDEGLAAAMGLFRFTAKAKELTALSSGDVPVRVRNYVGPELDPALVTGDEILFTRSNVDTTVSDIEDMFSLSIKNGIELVGSQLETLELDVLKQLLKADESLVEDKFPRNRTKQARLLQSTLRQFSSRLTKRSLGTKRGVCKNIDTFRKYLDATRNPDVLNDVRKGLRNLLHDSNNKFRAGLATTFGQPVAHRSKDVVLLIQFPITVSIATSDSSFGRPKDYLPYLLVEKHYVALTFDLFRALNEVNEGLHEASLPSEIYSLLDRVKSLVSGRVVRDKKILLEDPEIRLGSSTDVIEYVNGQFVLSREGA
ncbi:MAG: hypothetical protein DIZ80_00400 [endosymbiont of Galathealinum brachiosum]|uniref:Uncharacterized protein n=1 Tax=endosymbiont of Galathealinum brachiosum TaxID=2200906 RepID=A0A370DM35_9GAMM|nr:MAG: hypothetical protein DIZ80_00400 [endosymbiont of Galathealinum brachiosum]